KKMASSKTEDAIFFLVCISIRSVIRCLQKRSQLAGVGFSITCVVVKFMHDWKIRNLEIVAVRTNGVKPALALTRERRSALGVASRIT
ncbi:hypothetical protein, partial [Levilactobacillus parabrevis]